MESRPAYENLFAYATKKNATSEFVILNEGHTGKVNHFVIPVSRDRERIRQYGDLASQQQSSRNGEVVLINLVHLIDSGVIPKDRILDLDKK